MNKTLIGALVVVVVVVGAILLFKKDAAAPADDAQNEIVTPTPTPAETPVTPNPTPAMATPVTVNYTDSGYSANSITVKKGTAVTFKNNSTKTMWPASAPHPTHTDYSAFDPKKAIAVGGSWSFTFDQVGTWKYHDHLNPSKFGTVVVTE